jgi:hypothetical protein
MTETEATGRKSPPGRTRIALALLAATAALAGTQAFAPAPAVALINQGNECQNLAPWEVTICEMENGGGGSGGAGGSGQIVGVETIEIHDALSPCQRSPLSCLPSSGRPNLGSDDAGRLSHGKHGGRPIRVAEAPRGNSWPTLDDCKKLQAGRLALRADAKLAWYSNAIATLDRKVQDLLVQEEHLRSERSRLERLSAPGPAIDGLTGAIELLQGRRFPLQFDRFHYFQRFRDLRHQRGDDEATLRWKCKNLHWPLFDD